MSNFVFLDSSRSIPQSIQHFIIREFANQMKITINFYGAEMFGFEHRHMLLKDYLNSNRSQAYIFFSIKQFLKEDKTYDLHLLNLFSIKGINLYFANEKISLSTKSEFEHFYHKLLISEICDSNKNVFMNS
tara:strand:- start:600 stop:992 length:393 start_codon:yes stop_codon:yes gene_type:complete